jgi:hypothetical protein
MPRHFVTSWVCVVASSFVATGVAQVPAALQARHGTCAIVAASSHNMAFVIDSRLTALSDVGTTRSCTARREPGCKAVLVRKDVLVGVTGLYNDPINGVNWIARDETRKLLLALPKVLEQKDLDDFATAWLRSVANHFYRNSKSKFLSEDREVSTLLVATRIHGIPYVVTAPIDFEGDKGFHLVVKGKLLSDPHPFLYYAGSCRDHITTHTLDATLHVPQTIPPVDPLPASLKSELDAIANERTIWSSAADLADILKRLEDVFTRADQAAGICYIGPPYDVATWAEGESGWTTHFKRSCQQSASHAMHRQN